MSKQLHLKNPPIVESVVDLDCDLPPDLDFEALEAKVRESYRDTYAKFRKRYAQIHEIKTAGDASISETSMKRTLDGFQVLGEDEKQIVQVRRLGYSFNRLAPYPGLDKLLPEIHRTWELFRSLTSPRQIRRIQLRYINRIMVPVSKGQTDLDQYLKCGPRLPDEAGLRLAGFLNQYSAVESATGLSVHTVLTRQPVDGNHICLIFDNAAIDEQPLETGAWPDISRRIDDLRRLKNRVFENTLTKKCLNLFR